MTWEHAVVLILLVIGIAVGVHGIRMERRARRESRSAAMRMHPSNYDDMAAEIRREQEFTRIRRAHINDIAAAEVHE